MNSVVVLGYRIISVGVLYTTVYTYYFIGSNIHYTVQYIHNTTYTNINTYILLPLLLLLLLLRMIKIIIIIILLLTYLSNSTDRNGIGVSLSLAA